MAATGEVASTAVTAYGAAATAITAKATAIGVASDTINWYLRHDKQQ